MLDTTRDPQLSDIVLDRWTYREMTQLAGDTGSAFLLGYVRTQIDAANLRTLIRVARMGKSGEFLRGVLLSGGEVPPESMEKAGAARSGRDYGALCPPPGSRRRQKPAPRPCRAVP